VSGSAQLFPDALPVHWQPVFQLLQSVWEEAFILPAQVRSAQFYPVPAIQILPAKSVRVGHTIEGEASEEMVYVQLLKPFWQPPPAVVFPVHRQVDFH